MLGSEITRVATEKGVPLVEVSRSRGIFFDAKLGDFSALAREIGLGPEDWLVNAIGWIPQKTKNDPKKDAEDARVLNTELPSSISRSREEFGFNWIQIATDCVFSGGEGDYSEHSLMNAKDTYGISKIDGERCSHGDIRIRCSVIGPAKDQFGLFEWFKSESLKGQTIPGFTNHVWNGVTSHAFAKLAVGLMATGHSASLLHHLVPNDKVSKYELLTLFGAKLGSTAQIRGTLASESVDRTLTTVQPELNEKLWRLAGYASVPKISALVHELPCRN
mgnify:CR=1 FL=1